MRRTLVGSTAVAVVFWATTALAAPPQLMGEYAFTGSTGCLWDPNGFNPATLVPIDDSVYSSSNNVEGVRTFNGDGTGTVRATEVGITPPPPAPGFAGPGADAATITFSFTYTVNGDGTFTTQLMPGTFLGTFFQGPRTGQTFTIDKIDLTGQTTNDNKVLTLATVQAEVETVTFSNGDVRPRICHRSRVLTWTGQ